jgi:hypothetical protein
MIVDQLLLRLSHGSVTRVVDGSQSSASVSCGRIAFQPSQARALPRSDVLRLAPRSNARRGSGCAAACCAVTPVQQRKHRWSMPRFTFKRASKLDLECDPLP